MRRDLIDHEIAQFNKAISELPYNKAAERPSMTLIVVNKRISQRFFVDDGNNVFNPPSGCIIDTDIVQESHDEKTYDFFLIPQETTQGCVLPTHFFVAYDSSVVNRSAIKNLTYTLCYSYQNWCGAIKVPAPCMYAHKIAELFMKLGAGGELKDTYGEFDMMD